MQVEVRSSGQRPLTFEALRGRRLSVDTDRTVSRKELSAAGRDAAKALKLRASVRLVLSELCAVWGEQEWERLIVWPSNDHLISRTGLSERAVRYALRDLVACGVVTPRDSANGKRFAIRAPGGAIIDAFGFDLTPLYARRGEWVERIAMQSAQDERRRRSFDLLTCARRAVSEALHGLATRYPEISISDLAAAHAELERSSPKRLRAADEPDMALEAWLQLQVMAEERFYQAGCAGKSCSHIETNNGSPIEICKNGSPKRAGPVLQNEQPAVPLTGSLLLQALPAVGEFVSEAPALPELIEAGHDLRGAIGAHHSAWVEACEALGRHRAALLVLIVFQLHTDDVTRGEHRMRNPGGYFRQLARLSAEGRYGIEAEILTMRRRRMT